MPVVAMPVAVAVAVAAGVQVVVVGAGVALWAVGADAEHVLHLAGKAGVQRRLELPLPQRREYLPRKGGEGGEGW